MDSQLTPNALRVLEARYLWRERDGKVTETPDALFTRVARTIAAVEKRDRSRWETKYRELMASLRFLPNTPTLMNAGKPKGQLSACFVLPIADSLDSIFNTLKEAAKIHQSGGGTGFSFSNLRPAGAFVGTNFGASSGPVSFLRIYDMATETIKQGGARRGANMAILRVDHADIFEFIDCKRDLKSITNFNISVGITDEFMRAALASEEFSLRDPHDGRVTKRVKATEILDRIMRAAWECGDPGLVFLDRINQLNPTPKLGAMESTNPCGEQPLLAYESCNLGSINVGAYVKGREIDWPALGADVRLATRFLDSAIDANHFPVPKCARITKKNRKIGLGVMGFADLLLELGIPYDTSAATELGEKLMGFLARQARRESAGLARERGAFANFSGSLWDRLGYPPLRNATVSTVAPTGTISIIAGASSGIEPIFSARIARNVLDGERLEEIHPAVARELMKKRAPINGTKEAEIAKILGPAWRPAQALSVEWHVAMQAAFQRHSDSAVSKTINLPESATVEDVKKAYLSAYRKGCKGITIYRDRSRPTQVLEKATTTEPAGEICPAC